MCLSINRYTKYFHYSRNKVLKMLRLNTIILEYSKLKIEEVKK